MRKVFLILLILGLFYPLIGEESAKSPIDLKSLIIGGGISFTSYQGDLYGNTSTLTISPSLLYFIKKGLALGAVLEFTTTGYEDHGSQTGFSFGPTVIYFFPSLTKAADRITGSIYPFIQGGFLLHGDSLTNGEHYSATGKKIPLSVGIAVMISKTTAVFIKAFYSFDNLKDESTKENIKGNQVGLNIGFNFFKYKK